MKHRQTETKAYLKKALTLLLQDTEIEHLTISQITKKAGINRSTFYLHYQDKYDFINHLKDDTWQEIDILLERHKHQPRAGILAILQFLKGDFDFISAIANSLFLNLSESIKDFTRHLLSPDEQIAEALVEAYRIPYPYALTVYLSSIESIISLWIETGGQESPEEMTDIILTVVDLGNQFQ
ncbi:MULTISPECIES: TetR/AcrR family transcriptional regulator [unclassified Streptococcus]|uniref:TetR/AcrR family transcriptional regulator n=1 Tax=unclassified Streptococcus TaxID=2608887 RepID=UPI00359D10C3